MTLYREYCFPNCAKLCELTDVGFRGSDRPNCPSLDPPDTQQSDVKFGETQRAAVLQLTGKRTCTNIPDYQPMPL